MSIFDEICDKPQVSCRECEYVRDQPSVMDNIIKGIMDASAEALKRGIKANAVFISDRLFFSKLSPFFGEVPIVCGLKAYYTVELPDDVLFAVAHRDERKMVEERCGEWVPLEYDGYADGYPVWDLWECSECGQEHSGDEDTLTPYCPNCGAKMDGKEAKR